MGTDIALLLIGIGVAIIIFILEKTMKGMPLRVAIIGYAASAILLGIACLLLTNHYNTLSLFLLIGVVILIAFIYIGFRAKYFEKVKNIRFRTPIIFATMPKVSEEERELLNLYERQKANWHFYIRLKLVRVESHTKAASPYLILTLEVHNYLPVGFTMVKVSETEGSVGQCNLPPLPENLDKKINACTEDQFTITVGVNGTKIPEFLQSQEALGKPRMLQWYLKGVWYAHIYGEIQPIKYKADNLWCESLLAIME